MTGDRAEALLAEIRDAQREHLELYRQALAEQKASIENQRDAIAYQKRAFRMGLLVILPILAFVIGLIVWMLIRFF